MSRANSSINRLPSGSWQVRWRDTNGRQRSQSFRVKGDALAFAEQTRSEVRRGTWVDPQLGRERFVDFARRWAEGQDWKQTTRDSFGPHLNRLTAQLGDAAVGDIDRLVLQQVRQRLIAKYAHSTASITWHYGATIMRAAFQAGIVPRDPTVGLKPPRRRAGDPDDTVGPDDVPTRSEALALLNAAPPAYRATIALGIAGLRVSEMLAVTADRFDPATGELLIDRQLQRMGGVLQFTSPKREKVRRIVLPGLTRIELRRHLRDHQGAGLLFRGRRGAEMLRRDQFYASVWRPTLVAAGMEPDRFVFHSLRHFAASSLLADGAPITAVAGHLGDTVETVSKVYAHWLRDDREVPALVLDRLLVGDGARHDVTEDAVRGAPAPG